MEEREAAPRSAAVAAPASAKAPFPITAASTSTATAGEDPAVPSPAGNSRASALTRRLPLAAICLLLSAAAGAALTMWSGSPAGPAVPGAAGADAAPLTPALIGHRLALLAGTAALTALVEELVFRGVLLRALLRALPHTRALLASALLFALPHALPIGLGSAEAAPDMAAAALSLGLKFAQALAFGLVMASVAAPRDHVRASGLAIAVALHGLYDAVYFAPAVLATGTFPATYITAQPNELAALAASILLLAPAAVRTQRTQV
ncbi:CPBP family glutamic-type intramembrane protease [Adlercreutzia sp. R21]|uniref:CPBP family glutamic-type intramembrane protease n=1 Tax=Adlercreutzia wanghongyangiae TaxID=3111451 RepID=UPI002DBCE617|nr:CPBP family glutamic-type intramembrane protease [Adlercreutzia sp. R21]MEC4183448.1 CPBP family glutamic-type intramembrane protease [Adlercreutzia sp. R21]